MPSGETSEAVLRLPARRDSLSASKDFMARYFADMDVPDRALLRAELAVEELVTNIIFYAYGPRENADFELSVTRLENALQIRVSDHGRPFDPLSHPPPDTGSPIEKRAPGGLGIHLARNMADHLRYSRENNCNIMTVIVRTDREPGKNEMPRSG